MDASQQTRILGYFIEEAKEHLETLEQGILELRSVASDTERVNELFRAAHSVKGGAAMLGFESIQKIAHRLEDAFKIFKENSIEVDQKLESLFLASYDVLQDLIEKLQGPFGLREEEGAEIVQGAETNFVQLQNYLNQLVRGEVKKVAKATKAPASVTKSQTAVKTASNAPNQVKAMLKQMLQIFKQEATTENRKQLQKICINLAKLATKEKNWQILLKTVYKAISNPKYSYNFLAPLVIREIKRGSDLIELGRADKISPSQSLQRIAEAKAPQILITVEPKEAAQALRGAFNKQQLVQLVQLLGVSESGGSRNNLDNI